jgi:hypothetical protein
VLNLALEYMRLGLFDDAGRLLRAATCASAPARGRAADR